MWTWEHFVKLLSVNTALLQIIAFPKCYKKNHLIQQECIEKYLQAGNISWYRGPVAQLFTGMYQSTWTCWFSHSSIKWDCWACGEQNSQKHEWTQTGRHTHTHTQTHTHTHICVYRGAAVATGVRGAVDKGCTKEVWSGTEGEGERGDSGQHKSKQDERRRVRGWGPCEGVPREQRLEGGGGRWGLHSQPKSHIQKAFWAHSCTSSPPYSNAKRTASFYTTIGPETVPRRLVKASHSLVFFSDIECQKKKKKKLNLAKLWQQLNAQSSHKTLHWSIHYMRVQVPSRFLFSVNHSAQPCRV